MLRETVKLSGFSTLEVRSRGERPGRNPLTGEIYPHPCSFELACAPVPNRRNAGAMATCSHQHIRTAFWATLTNSGQSMCLPAAEGLLATLFRPGTAINCSIQPVEAVHSTEEGQGPTQAATRRKYNMEDPRCELSGSRQKKTPEETNPGSVKRASDTSRNP